MLYICMCIKKALEKNIAKFKKKKSYRSMAMVMCAGLILPAELDDVLNFKGHSGHIFYCDTLYIYNHGIICLGQTKKLLFYMIREKLLLNTSSPPPPQCWLYSQIY